MLPIQLPIVPVSLFACSELHRTPSASAMRTGAGPSRRAASAACEEEAALTDLRGR